MWVNVWRYDKGPRQRALINLETAQVYVKRSENPFTRRYYLSYVVAEYPNGRCVRLAHGGLCDARQVMKAITMAVEAGYHYLDLTQLDC